MASSPWPSLLAFFTLIIVIASARAGSNDVEEMREEGLGFTWKKTISIRNATIPEDKPIFRLGRSSSDAGLGIPGFELFCIDCSTYGALEASFHVRLDLTPELDRHLDDIAVVKDDDESKTNYPEAHAKWFGCPSDFNATCVSCERFTLNSTAKSVSMCEEKCSQIHTTGECGARQQKRDSGFCSPEFVPGCEVCKKIGWPKGPIQDPGCLEECWMYFNSLDGDKLSEEVDDDYNCKSSSLTGPSPGTDRNDNECPIEDFEPGCQACHDVGYFSDKKPYPGCSHLCDLYYEELTEAMDYFDDCKSSATAVVASPTTEGTTLPRISSSSDLSSLWEHFPTLKFPTTTAAESAELSTTATESTKVFTSTTHSAEFPTTAKHSMELSTWTTRSAELSTTATHSLAHPKKPEHSKKPETTDKAQDLHVEKDTSHGHHGFNMPGEGLFSLTLFGAAVTIPQGMIPFEPVPQPVKEALLKWRSNPVKEFVKAMEQKGQEMAMATLYGEEAPPPYEDPVPPYPGSVLPPTPPASGINPPVMPVDPPTVAPPPDLPVSGKDPPLTPVSSPAVVPLPPDGFLPPALKPPVPPGDGDEPPLPPEEEPPEKCPLGLAAAEIALDAITRRHDAQSRRFRREEPLGNGLIGEDPFGKLTPWIRDHASELTMAVVASEDIHAGYQLKISSKSEFALISSIDWWGNDRISWGTSVSFKAQDSTPIEIKPEAFKGDKSGGWKSPLKWIDRKTAEKETKKKEKPLKSKFGQVQVEIAALNIKFSMAATGKLAMTLPGFSATIPKGSRYEVDVLKGKVIANTMEPQIEHRYVQWVGNSPGFTVSIAVGPSIKAKLIPGLDKIKLPKKKPEECADAVKSKFLKYVKWTVKKVKKVYDFFQSDWAEMMGDFIDATTSGEKSRISSEGGGGEPNSNQGSIRNGGLDGADDKNAGQWSTLVGNQGGQGSQGSGPGGDQDKDGLLTGPQDGRQEDGQDSGQGSSTGNNQNEDQRENQGGSQGSSGDSQRGGSHSGGKGDGKGNGKGGDGKRPKQVSTLDKAKKYGFGDPLAIGGKFDLVRLDYIFSTGKDIDKACNSTERMTRMQAVYRTGFAPYISIFAWRIDTSWLGKIDNSSVSTAGFYKSKKLWEKCLLRNGTRAKELEHTKHTNELVEINNATLAMGTDLDPGFSADSGHPVLDALRRYDYAMEDQASVNSSAGIFAEGFKIPAKDIGLENEKDEL